MQAYVELPLKQAPSMSVACVRSEIADSQTVSLAPSLRKDQEVARYVELEARCGAAMAFRRPLVSTCHEMLPLHVYTAP